MLSILIPTYNYDITKLVNELHKQCIKANIHFEIIVFDDGSKSLINKKNSTISDIKNCIFKALDENVGRSAIRNLLAVSAKYNHLLFIDAGTFPLNSSFISLYLRRLNSEVVSGGMIAEKFPARAPFKLRWLYTKYREKDELCSSNFLIHKNIILKFPFNETIRQYGYEDVLFFNVLKRDGILIEKIDNHVIHDNDDDANTFIKKTELAIQNLMVLIDNKIISHDQSKIIRYFLFLVNTKTTVLIAYIFKLTKRYLVQNFNSNYPSLLLYDFYRLGYLCNLKAKL